MRPYPGMRSLQMGLPRWLRGKEPTAVQEMGVCPCVGKLPWRRAWQPTSVFLPGDSHGQRSLTGYIQFMGWPRVRHG